MGQKRVLIVGCGGLGGNLISIFARIGVGNLRIVDGDVFEATNLNRQLFSEIPVLGRNKARVASDRLARINPDIAVDAVEAFLTEENAAALLVEVYGEGILLTGESGMGKSETAIELLKRGHRLIADDAVEIRKISGNTLMGTAPEVLRNFVELRGIGIINVAKLFGMGAVKAENEINLVVNIEPWNSQNVYDRMGAEVTYTEMLGVKVPMNTIPVTPGRNLAVILEVAAMNNRQRKMGYNAALELTEQINRKFEANMGNNV